MALMVTWAALVAFATVVLVTPAAAVAMTRLGVTDRPDGRRKLHGRDTPLAGGLAVFVAVAAAAWFGPRLTAASSPFGDLGFWAWFFAAACVITALGVADDAYRLRGRHKLLGQIFAVGLLLGSGLLVRRLGFFGWDVELGVLAVPFTMFWLLGAINAINLIDGMDGIASIVGGMIGFALCLLAGMNGHLAEATLAAAVAGGLAGFLVYNFPPAKVFLGDTGSMLVGLTLGVVAVRSSLKESATFAAAAPLAVWTLPILDVAMAILRRKLTGQSIYATDRAHLHHRLGDRGLSPRGTLLLVAALCLVTTAGAVGSVTLKAEFLAPVSAVVVIASLVATRSFGHSEFALLGRRTLTFASSLVPGGRFAFSRRREHRSRLQGNREWDRLWETLVTAAERLGVHELELHVRLPSIHEEFFAGWARPNAEGDSGTLYRADLPLGSPSGPIGVLRVAGPVPPGMGIGWVAGVVEALRPFEARVAEMLCPRGHAGHVPPAAAVAARSAPPPSLAATWDDEPRLVVTYSGGAAVGNASVL